MMNRKRMLIVLVILLGLMVAVQPVAGQPPHALTVSGHGCAYLDLTQMGEFEMTDQWVHIKGRVVRIENDSDNDQILPDGYEISVNNIKINLKTGMVHFNRTSTLYPEEGVNGTFEGVATGWAKPDLATGELQTHISGVFHGTGVFEGLTMKLTYRPGDSNLCEGTPSDTAFWTGFIVPPKK